VRTAGLEPTTSCSGGKRSIRLSYARNLACRLHEVAEPWPAFKTRSPNTAPPASPISPPAPTFAGMLQRDLVRVLGPRPLASITRRDLALVLDEVEGRGSPVAANRLLQYTKAMFTRLVERELLAAPAAGLRKRVRERTRNPVLTEADLIRVWAAADAFVRLLLTGLRRGELAGARRSDITDGVLAVRAKRGARHRVTLSRQALALIPARPGA
jgi:integrase